MCVSPICLSILAPTSYPPSSCTGPTQCASISPSSSYLGLLRRRHSPHTRQVISLHRLSCHDKRSPFLLFLPHFTPPADPHLSNFLFRSGRAQHLLNNKFRMSGVRLQLENALCPLNYLVQDSCLALVSVPLNHWLGRDLALVQEFALQPIQSLLGAYSRTWVLMSLQAC